MTYRAKEVESRRLVFGTNIHDIIAYRCVFSNFYQGNENGGILYASNSKLNLKFDQCKFLKCYSETSFSGVLHIEESSSININTCIAESFSAKIAQFGTLHSNSVSISESYFAKSGDRIDNTNDGMKIFANTQISHTNHTECYAKTCSLFSINGFNTTEIKNYIAFNNRVFTNPHIILSNTVLITISNSIFANNSCALKINSIINIYHSNTNITNSIFNNYFINNIYSYEGICTLKSCELDAQISDSTIKLENSKIQNFTIPLTTVKKPDIQLPVHKEIQKSLKRLDLTDYFEYAINHCIFKDIKSKSSGGAVFVDNSIGSLSIQSTFFTNIKSDLLGGAIYYSSLNGKGLISDSCFQDAKASQHAAIFASNDGFIMNNTFFIHNTASNSTIGLMKNSDLNNINLTSNNLNSLPGLVVRSDFKASFLLCYNIVTDGNINELVGNKNSILLSESIFYNISSINPASLFFIESTEIQISNSSFFGLMNLNLFNGTGQISFNNCLFDKFTCNSSYVTNDCTFTHSFNFEGISQSNLCSFKPRRSWLNLFLLIGGIILIVISIIAVIIIVYWRKCRPNKSLTTDSSLQHSQLLLPLYQN